MRGIGAQDERTEMGRMRCGYMLAPPLRLTERELLRAGPPRRLSSVGTGLGERRRSGTLTEGGDHRPYQP